MFQKGKTEKLMYGIVGLGRFGYALAMELSASDAELIIIDSDEEKIRELREVTENTFVVKKLDKKTLLDTGIQNCDVAVVCIGEHMDTSILTTLNLVSFGIPTVISKATSAEHGIILEKLGAEVIIMDDGYQHWHLERDLDVVLVDTLNMFGNGCVLPRGMLREPLENLDRGDLFLLTKTDQSSILSRMQLRKTIEKYNSKAPVVESVHHPKNFVEIADWYKGITQNHMSLSELEGKNVMVFSAIGNPSSFEQTLSSIGLNIKEAVRYPDHHDYGMLEMQYISERASSQKAVAMITTSKDAVKIPTEFIYSAREIPLYILNMDIQVTDGFDKFKECVLNAIQKEQDK